MNINKLKIIGCGGHAKVIIDALSQINHSMHISFCDGNQDLIGMKINGFLVDSTIDSLSDFAGFIHLAIGSNQARQNIVGLINDNTLLFTIIHPRAIISITSHIAPGAFIGAGAIIGPDSFVGLGTIINHGAVIDHDTHVGNFSHIAPNATLGGKVMVGEGVLVGAGAVILPGITIGDGAIIGAGAVVTKDVKKNTLVKGVPAA